MENNFLQLKNPYEQKDNENTIKVFDDVEIIVDPDLEDESTVDINKYLDKNILQCRICGNLFPSSELLTNEDECPICNSKSSNGFIYKGKLVTKNDKNNEFDDDSNFSDEINQEFNNDTIDNDADSEDEMTYNN